MNELETLKEFNLQLQMHFTLQYERIKKLEDAIRIHQSEMQNYLTNTEQIYDWNINKKLWNCL